MVTRKVGDREREAVLYPVFLRLNGCRVLVAGGGNVAQRKIEGLIASSSEIRVVAPDVLPAIRKWADEGQVNWFAREYQTADLEQVRMVFAATDREEVNRAIVAEAKHRGIWVNSATEPEFGDVLVPARILRGPLQVAVSTAGMSPAAARQIRDRIDASLEEEFGFYLELLQEIRNRVMAAVHDADRRAEIFRWFVQSELMELIAKEDPLHVREWIEARLRLFEVNP